MSFKIIIINCCYQEGGIKALYRGFTPTLIGMIPYAGLSFYCFESLKFLCMKHLPDWTCKSCSNNSGNYSYSLYLAYSFIFILFNFLIKLGGLVLTLPAKLLVGGLSGAIAQSFAYPFDVIRRRMQLALMTPEMQRWGYFFI